MGSGPRLRSPHLKRIHWAWDTPHPKQKHGWPGSLARLEQTAACVQVGPHLAAWLIFCCLFVSLADVCPSETSSNWGWCVRGAVLQFCASHFWKVCWRFKQTTRVTGQIWALKHTGSNEKNKRCSKPTPKIQKKVES